MGSRRGSNTEELVSFLSAADKLEDIDADDGDEDSAVAKEAAAPVNTEVVLVDLDPAPGYPDGTCGLGRLRSRCLQRLNHFELFLALLTLFGLCGGLQSALKSATLTKLERRFNFDSATSALVLMANDMVFLPSVLLVSYFGSLGHRPRLLGLSCFGYGVSALLFALPRFLFGPMPAHGEDGADAAQQLGYACPASTNASSSAAASGEPRGPGSASVAATERTQLTMGSLSNCDLMGGVPTSAAARQIKLSQLVKLWSDRGDSY